MPLVLIACYYVSGSAHLRLVVLGGPSAGKTTTANAILGQDAFQEAETMGSSVQTRNIRGRCISLIDTPRSLLGSFSSDEQQNGELLEKCLSLAAPGPHAFLLVIPLGTSPVSAEGARVVECIRQQLGEDALRMTVVLFTRRERVTRREWDHFLLRQEVQHLIRSCGGGYHTMNSKAEVQPCQVTELLEKVNTMVERSGGEHYMIDRFLQAQRRGERKEEKVSALLEKEERKWGDIRREMEMRKQKREEEKRKEEEERKRREEERKKKDLQELQERERRRKKQEERERVERERRTLEEVKNRQQQERQRLEEEERQQEEVRQRLEEERRLQEEVRQRLEQDWERQEEVSRRLEQERERQQQETQRLVQERRRMEAERMREEQNQQVARGREVNGQKQEDRWRIAERCAAVAGSFLAPFLFRR